MLIAIVALDGSMLSPIAGLSDLFWITDQALRSPFGRERIGNSVRDMPEFRTVIVSGDGSTLRDPQGRVIQVDMAFNDLERCDAILVAGMALDQEGLPPASPTVKHAARWLSHQYAKGALIGAACAGTFVLGEGGLLDGRRCTTTWWLHNTFRNRFPKACPVWGAAVEEDGRVVTTGGPLSWIDLGLHVIRTFAGPEVAKLAADIAVIDSVPLPQSIYAPRGFINTTDALLLKAEQIIRNVGSGFTAKDLAAQLNLSSRTLHRKLDQLTGESPKELITRVRIETACILLDVPGAGIKNVAAKCGYNDETSFRRAFSRLMGMTPRKYKQWSAQHKSNSHGTVDLGMRIE